MNDYIETNRKTYDLLAMEYNERDYEIKSDFWYKIYDDLALKESNNLQVLEIGPGCGRNIGFLKNYNDRFNITAIELSKEMCKIIENKYPDIELINEDVLKYNFKEKKYDIIQMIAVIHLFPIVDAKLLLEKVKCILKDDGYLIIGTTINEKDYEGYLEKDDYGIKTKRFRHTYTKESYDELLLSCGFQIYKPYYVCENSRNKLWYDVVVRKK